MTTTIIENADWAVTWDDANGNHTYQQAIDVVFDDSGIVHIGAGYTGEVDERIDGHGLMVMPGLIDLHSHPFVEPFYRGIREEHGVPEMYMTGLFERGCAYRPDPNDMAAAAAVAYSELLLSGVTSLADISAPYPGWLDHTVKSGMRTWLAPGFASARWRLENRHQLLFDWDEAGGREKMDTALALIDQARGHQCGRLSGMVGPSQIDTCTPDLLRDGFDAASERGLPFTTHASQSVNEFLIMVDRHGKTPLQYAGDLGILGPATTIAHSIFIDEHSWTNWHSREDVSRLADAGASIAHCPTPFARYGHVLEDFGRYRAAGVNIGIGTDTLPHNLIEEMRWAAVLARVAGRDIRAASTADVFHAATVGGAKALGREDIGRLAVGAKADLVLVDLSDPLMRPIRDPLRSLIFSAADRAIRDVFIDGQVVVRNRQVLTLDREAALEQLQEAQARMEAIVPDTDYAGRSSLEISPLTLPMRTQNTVHGAAGGQPGRRG